MILQQLLFLQHYKAEFLSPKEQKLASQSLLFLNKKYTHEQTCNMQFFIFV